VNRDLERIVREFIIENFTFEDDGSLTPEASLLESGVIDSTGVLELITFVEETYGIKVEDNEIVPENLDSIRNVASFVDRRLSVSSNTRCATAN
jgi:acyl carrier protein